MRASEARRALPGSHVVAVAREALGKWYIVIRAQAGIPFPYLGEVRMGKVIHVKMDPRLHADDLLRGSLADDGVFPTCRRGGRRFLAGQR